MIKIEKLIHDYIKRDDEGNVAGTVRAINGVDLQVEPGQFIAVLGHNGSGKSTLAKHLNALLFPTEGAVWVDGMSTKDEKNLWEIRRVAGMVFQNPDNQIIAQVVEEDVGFGPENMGVPTEEIWTRVEQSLAAVGMLEHRKKSPNRLSGGQKQRIILITHYMEEAIDADVIFVMDKGEVAMQGTPREIFSQVEKMQELQLDVPQVTLLGHELRKAGLNIPVCILTKEELADALLGTEDAQSGSCSENSAASDGNKQAAASAKEKEETGNGDQS